MPSRIGWRREQAAEVFTVPAWYNLEGRYTKRMSRDFSRAFYDSQVWKNCRNGYMETVNRLCERCLSKGLIVPAEIVHHKIELNPDNINNPDITLSYNNLEAVCRDCHADIHNRKARRYKILDDGVVVGREME